MTYERFLRFSAKIFRRVHVCQTYETDILTSCFLCGVSFSYAVFFSSLLKDNFHLLAPDRLAVSVSLVVETHQVVYHVPFRNYDDGSISYVVFLHFSRFSPYKFYFLVFLSVLKQTKVLTFTFLSAIIKAHHSK